MKSSAVSGNSQSELLTFKYIDLTLLVTRFLMFIFFAIQTSRHIKKNGRQTDRLSILTFVCLGASFFIFLVYGSLKAVLDVKRLTISNHEEEM
jgi:uncharacterized protein with PQ loop repeat